MSFRSRPISLDRQQGSTLVGIIIGLVIGLVIAVIVALVITKGATPFTDKSGKVGKSAEPTAGQISDPNKPMYGNKQPAREAARDFSRDSAAAPAAPAAAPAAPAAPSKPAVDELQQVVDKIEAAGKTKQGATNVQPTPTGPGAAAAAAGEDKFVYYLQAGAFREVADAENTRAKLALLGFEATVSDRTTDTGVLHRVRMGPYNQVETMNKVRSKLSENGIDVAVVRNQK